MPDGLTYVEYKNAKPTLKKNKTISCTLTIRGDNRGKQEEVRGMNRGDQLKSTDYENFSGKCSAFAKF